MTSFRCPDEGGVSELLRLDYDFCFIDTPPSLGWLTQSAFYASHQSIICVTPEPYSLLGLQRLKDYHIAIKENHDIEALGVLVTFWDARGAANEAYLDSNRVFLPWKDFQHESTQRYGRQPGDLKGKTYFNFQLVESYRTPRGPRQRILLSLGSDLDLTKEECHFLANRIEEIIYGQNALLIATEKIETLAQAFAAKWVNTESTEQTKKESAEFKTIDLNTIEHSEARSIGAEHILLHLVNEIELPKKLRQMGMAEKQIKLSLASIIARAVAPASERANIALAHPSQRPWAS